MSTKDLEAFERRFFKEWNKGKAAAMKVIDEACASSVVWHSGNGPDIRGLKDYKKSMGDFFDAFPDNHLTIEDVIAEGDKATVRYTITGTHKGEYMGVAATNKKITLMAIEIDRIVGGKYVESWITYDTFSMMQQLGIIPETQK
jgi:predicted ester cyclase